MASPSSYRIPNLVIATRVVLAFVAAAMLTSPEPWVVAAGVALIVVAVAMDGLDGYVARRMGLASELGAVLDITADRIVEHLFWIVFAVAGKVGVWVPLVVMTRSFLVDAVRGLALARGRTAFGRATMMRSDVGRFLTGSRVMRTLYGGAKVAAFVLLGVGIAAWRAEAAGSSLIGDAARGAIDTAAAVSVYLAVALCLARGIPVLLDGRAYLGPGRT